MNNAVCVKRIPAILALACAGCTPQSSSTTATETTMTVTAHGSECLITLGGQKFVTNRLESTALLKRLQGPPGDTIQLQFLADPPYRCIGFAIATLQRAKVKFIAPQIPTE